MTVVQRRIAWVDDDAPGRFLNEEDTIIEWGGIVIWGTTIAKGVEILSTQPVDALILDQMMPWSETDRDPWAGCILLRWLRGAPPPPAAPMHTLLPQFDPWKLGRSPLLENVRIPALIASAFHNAGIEEATRAASSLDREFRLCAKPLELSHIRRLWERCGRE